MDFLENVTMRQWAILVGALGGAYVFKDSLAKLMGKLKPATSVNIQPDKGNQHWVTIRDLNQLGHESGNHKMVDASRDMALAMLEDND